jgi:CRP-like cAMP-binding protein
MGDEVKDFYFLTSGLARYYYLTEDGKEFNKSLAEVEGHLISSISSVARRFFTFKCKRTL